MKFFIDISQRQLVNSPYTTNQPITTPIFYENNRPDIYMQLLQPNPNGGSGYPYTAYNPQVDNVNPTMTVGLGFPINGTSSYVVDTQVMTFDTNSMYFSGSLNLTGSRIQSLMSAGSQSYLEFQESGSHNGRLYVRTWIQQSVTLLPSVV